MKRVLLLLWIMLSMFSPFAALSARAQGETPPTGPLGEIRGTVINENSGKVVTESLEVMLHILDLDYVDKGMEHGQSQPDGTFIFLDIPFDANTLFSVMATYNGVTYFSETKPADMTSLAVDINIPVYESTTDLADVRVDQMHVLFESSPDGLETKELYIISNLGERTVKDVFDLGEGKFATLKFPLPEDADYIFFQPDDQERFVKLSGAFADTYALLPGGQPLQIMTSYLIPYSGKREFIYTAPVDVAQINFLLPVQAGISLKGSGLAGPEETTLQDGSSYQVYSYSNLKAGQTLRITLAGGMAGGSQSTSGTKNLIAGLAAIMGFGVIGFGLWRWRTSATAEADEDVSAEPAEQTLDQLITEIARLDEKYEQEDISSEEYQRQRQALIQKAKQRL
jgi:hypothetical protein